MPKFMMAYLPNGSQPADPDAMMERWDTWMNDHAAQLIEPQNPFGPRRTVSADGISEGSSLPMMGYSVIEASDIDAAAQMAATCPFTEIGDLEIAQIMED